MYIVVFRFSSVVSGKERPKSSDQLVSDNTQVWSTCTHSLIQSSYVLSLLDRSNPAVENLAILRTNFALCALLLQEKPHGVRKR